MLDVYKGRIESEFLSFTEKIKSVRRELYTDVARSCIDAMCKGVKIGIYSGIGQPPVLDFTDESVRSSIR